MTNHKQQKAAIRARMKKTGEHYITARLHVVGMPNPKANPKVGAEMPFGRGAEHTASLLTHLLGRSGATNPATRAPFTEPEVLGLSGGIGFMGLLFDYKGHLPIITLVMRSHPAPMANSLLDRLGVNYVTEQTGSGSKAAASLDAHLDAGRACLLTVGRGGLPHHVVPEIEAGEAYDILVVDRENSASVGIDDVASSATVISRSTLDAARRASTKTKNELIAIIDGGVTTNPTEYYQHAIEQTVANLTEPVLGNAFDVNFGIRGMEKLAASLRDTRTKKGWPHVLVAPDAFAFGMVRLHQCLTNDYGGPSALRPTYATFLRGAATVLPNGAGCLRQPTCSTRPARRGSTPPNWPSRPPDHRCRTLRSPPHARHSISVGTPSWPAATPR